MFKSLSFKLMSVLSLVALLSACAQPVKRPDYTAFKKSQPRSILVLPPLNETSEVGATYGMLSQMTLPLARIRYTVPYCDTFVYSAASDEGSNSGGGGLIGMLVVAAVKQIANTLMDQSHDVAAFTSGRLLTAGPPTGLLYGPHSPKYGTD